MAAMKTDLAQAIRAVVDEAAEEDRTPSERELRTAGVPRRWRGALRGELLRSEDKAEIIERYSTEIATDWDRSISDIVSEVPR